MNKKTEQHFYNTVAKINGWDFSHLKYKVIHNSSFKYFEEINKVLTKDSVILDIGTGAGEKLEKEISDNCKLKIGTDFSEEMIKRAKQERESDKIQFFKMDSFNLDFPDNHFSVISARHTPFSPKEVYRLLKKDGIFFSEQIDEQDCIKLKEIFERGQGYKEKIKLIDKIKEELKPFSFSKIDFFEIEEKEYYETEEDFIFLLKNTPIIPDLGKKEKDSEKIYQYIEKYKTKDGILLERKLFGIKIVK